MIHGEIMETKKVGRPKKLKLVRIETSIEVVRDELKAKYPYDLSIATKKTPTKKRKNLFCTLSVQVSLI